MTVSQYDKPTRDVQAGETVERTLNADCVDIEIPRAEETETHCTVHARGNDRIDPQFRPWHEGYRVDKRTHDIDLRKNQPDGMHHLTISPRGAGGE